MMKIPNIYDKDQTDVVPEVGKVYHVFDGGKIRLSRHYLDKVIEVIPFKDFQTREDMKDAFAMWQQAVKNSYWLFAEATDFIVVTEGYPEPDKEEPRVFYARTHDKGWFGFGELFNGNLDSDRHLWEGFMKSVREGTTWDYDADDLAEIAEMDKY